MMTAMLVMRISSDLERGQQRLLRQRAPTLAKLGRSTEKVSLIFCVIVRADIRVTVAQQIFLNLHTTEHHGFNSIAVT